MTKPNAIKWLESQTGQTVPYVPEVAASSAGSRHLSVRLDRDLAVEVEAMAAERGPTVSQVVRDVLSDAVERRRSSASLDARALLDRLTADVAGVGRRLGG